MKTFLKFASIPVGLFVVFFGLPWIFQALFNSHTDIGLGAIVLLASGIVGFIASKIYDIYLSFKENNNED